MQALIHLWLAYVVSLRVALPLLSHLSKRSKEVEPADALCNAVIINGKQLLSTPVRMKSDRLLSL